MVLLWLMLACGTKAPEVQTPQPTELAAPAPAEDNVTPAVEPAPNPPLFPLKEPTGVDLSEDAKACFKECTRRRMAESVAWEVVERECLAGCTAQEK